MNWLLNFIRSKSGTTSPALNIANKPNLPDISCISERYEQLNADAYVSLLCEGYRLRGSFTLKEIADFVREHRDQYPNRVLFATLDDVWQAAYTSGHSIDKHDLDSIEGHDLTNLPESVFEENENGIEHQGYLSLIEEFPIRHHNFMQKTIGVTTAQLMGKLWWMEEESYFFALMTNSDLVSLTREENSFVQIVPVQSPSEALAAYPNGYFSDDLNPFENYTLAKELAEQFEFNLFGVGATYLGFMRDTCLDVDEAKLLGSFLARFFENYSGSPPLETVIAKKLNGERELYLAYGAR